MPDTMRALTRIVYGRRFEHVPREVRVYLRPGDRHIRGLLGRWRQRRARVLPLARYRGLTPVRDNEEFIGCALCGETRQQPLFRPRSADGAWEYRVVRCPGCGFLYRNPNVRPERLGELYATGYSAFLTGRYARRRQRRYELTMAALSPVFDDGTGRRLLDFGCGTGLFLELAQRRGFAGFGVDLSPDSIALARRRLADAVVAFGSPLEVPGIAAGGFDVITMWSVLAHLPRPVEDLSMLRGLLGPDGVLVIFTVNAGSLQLQGSGGRWGGFTRNHLMFYSRRTLPLLLARAGFAGVGFAPYHGDDVEAGSCELTPAEVDRVRRRVVATDGGNMIRAVGFASPASMARWGTALADLRPLAG